MRNSVSFDICDQAHNYWEIKDYTQTWTEPLSQGNLHMTKWTHLSSAWRTPGKVHTELARDRAVAQCQYGKGGRPERQTGNSTATDCDRCTVAS